MRTFINFGTFRNHNSACHALEANPTNVAIQEGLGEGENVDALASNSEESDHNGAE